MAIDGTYKGTAKSMMGSADCEITLKEGAGGTLSGTASAMGINASIQNGTVSGNDFTCEVEGDGPLGHMTLTIAGTVEGDRISGTIAAGRMKAKFEGTRA
jgi:hypothetical protein